MTELILEPATRQTLEKIRHAKGLLPIHDLPNDLAEQAVRAFVSCVPDHLCHLRNLRLVLAGPWYLLLT